MDLIHRFSILVDELKISESIYLQKRSDGIAKHYALILKTKKSAFPIGVIWENGQLKDYAKEMASSIQELIEFDERTSFTKGGEE